VKKSMRLRRADELSLQTGRVDFRARNPHPGREKVAADSLPHQTDSKGVNIVFTIKLPATIDRHEFAEKTVDPKYNWV